MTNEEALKIVEDTLEAMKPTEDTFDVAFWECVYTAIGTNEDLTAMLEDEREQKRMLINALADMVTQFAYRSTYRNGEAVYDGGLSALENAFNALENCGVPAHGSKILLKDVLKVYNDTL